MSQASIILCFALALPVVIYMVYLTWKDPNA